MAAVVTWPRRLRVSPAISLSSLSSLSLLLTTYYISIRLPYNHVKDKKSCTLPNTKTRYTLDTSTKQWSGQDLIIRTQSTAIFLCIQPFSARWQTNKQPTEQPGDPSASLLLTSEKAVFCNVLLLDGTKTTVIDKDSYNTLICTSGFVEDIRVAL